MLQRTPLWTWLCLLAISLLSACTQLAEEPQNSQQDAIRTTISKSHDRSSREQGDPGLYGVVTPRSTQANARLDGNNKFGIWLWYLEGTGYSSHAALAQKLYDVGIRRVYVKVADGSYNPTAWPEVDNAAVVNAYKAKGIEVWAWAYNYPGNDAAQAKSIYQAAKAGYQGFVTDIEIEFDRKTTELHNLFKAFRSEIDRAKKDGYAGSDFKLYCTSWGNPVDHGMRVDIIDQYVDAHMPQTYLEVWGSSYMANASYWIDHGTQEYRNQGCTKPIHHILSAEHELITSSQLNTSFQRSGAETSLWRIPGGGTSLNIWNTIAGMNWAYSFASSTSVTVNTPANIAVGQAATFTGTASSGITTVSATLDGYAIGTATVSNGSYTFTQTFNTAGANRQLVVRGLSSSGAELARVTKTIQVNSSSAYVQVQVPASIYVGSAATFTGTVSSGIVKVSATLDGYAIGEATVSNGSYALTQTFNTAGNNRQLVVRGLNSSGTELARNTQAINILAATQPYIANVPYFYQYSNSINPGGSCQNTTMAMLLNFYGGNATPDQLSSYYGTSAAQTVSGFTNQFNADAQYMKLNVRLTGITNGTFAKLKQLLDAKQPVPIHGYFTDYGHVMLVVGYDTNYYYCHDPAGKWSQVYKYGGYSQTNTTEGKYIRYSKAAFEQAVGPDGTMWIYQINRI